MTPLALATGPTLGLAAATFIALCIVGIWDCRRTFRRVDEARPHRVKPVDFSEEIRVTRGDRRGPEPVDHHGRKRVGL